MTELSAFDVSAPPSLVEFFRRLLSHDFMPHGHCYFWRPEILWLHVISDLLIMAAYYSIPVMLIYFILKKRDVPFHWMFLMFGAFIFLCGTTHLMDVWTTWSAAYRLEGLVKLATAIVSVTTAILLAPLVPKALALPTPEELKRINVQLQREVAERQQAEANMERRAQELTQANAELARFNQAMVNREARIIELKGIVNTLSSRLGEAPPHDLSFKPGDRQA